MRQKFIQQKSIGTESISEVKIPSITRDELPPVLKALQHIFITPELNENVFRILSQSIDNVDINKGRRGMSLWEILVLAVIRNSLDTNYDRLHDFANYHLLVRKIMGVHIAFGYDENSDTQQYGLQTIKDNVKLLTTDIIDQINTLVIETGHRLVKKKEDEKLKICVDTYALESNVHFPTDLNLLWDSIRKTIAIFVYLSVNYNIKGWRKEKEWRRKLKGVFRVSAKVHKSGGKNKNVRLKAIVSAYLNLSKLLLDKTLRSIDEMSKSGITDLKFAAKLIELDYYKDMLIKHIDLVERRIIKDETIPASEKLVSIFEIHTEWLQKGKSGRKKVEFGHNMLIASDQFQFIVYHKVIEAVADVDLTEETINELYEKYPGLLYSASFDKGFSSKKVKEVIISSGKVEKLILPKRGKRNKEEQEEENSKEFKQLKNKHSRVESDINRLEHNGLNTCPDKGIENFKRYASIGVLSYNLHNLGRILIKQELKEKDRLKKRQAA
ncbi:MAG: ISNCY family transposase [Bacteroidales bacterium]|nr:ISNCY family transposase [Bacteroidales bacterium]